MLNIIFFITMYPVLFLLYFIIRSKYKYQDGRLFSVSMKDEWIKDTQVQAIIATFKNQMNLYLVIMMITPFSTLLTEHFSIQLTIWMLWLLVLIFLFYLPFVIANIKLKEWKKQHHLYEEQRLDRYFEMKSAGKVRKVRTIPFLIPTLLSFLIAAGVSFLPEILANTAIFDTSIGMSAVNFVLAACTPFLWIAAICIDRQPVEVISNDSNVNINYARAKKNTWKNFWLICAWLNTGFTALVSIFSVLTYGSGMIILVGSIIYTLLVLLLCIPLVTRIKKINESYESRRDLIDIDYDDDQWIGGIAYYNPNDNHTLVEARIGVGTTINMATPLGKGLLIISIIALLSIPLSCVWVIMEEFTPIDLRVEDGTLYARHLNVDYELDVDDIENVLLITELPSMSKTNGSAMDNLEKGEFHIRNHGKCQVFLNPQNTKFIVFTCNGTEYYMGGYDDNQTQEVYDSIIE